MERYISGYRVPPSGINRFKSKFNKENGLGKFKGIHKGESAILFANGPSRKDYVPFDGSEECIKIGVNAIYNHNTPEEIEKLNYWFFGSEYFRKDGNPGRDKAEDMDAVCLNPRYKNLVKLTSSYEHGKSHGEIGRGNITPERSRELGCIPFENNLETFTNDLEVYSTVGHSIAFPALQFILYTGVKRIYLVGCDGGFTDPECNQTNDPWLMHWWGEFKKFKDICYPDIEIVNINSVGLKGWFIDATVED